MTRFAVITSLNNAYYHMVGHRMIESFLKYWPEEIDLYIYSEEKLSFEIKNDRIKTINILEAQEQLVKFISRSEKRQDAEELKKSLKKRTLTDKNRKHSPLIRVSDSILIRSDKLTKKQVISKIIN